MSRIIKWFKSEVCETFGHSLTVHRYVHGVSIRCERCQRETRIG